MEADIKIIKNTFYLFHFSNRNENKEHFKRHIYSEIYI